MVAVGFAHVAATLNAIAKPCQPLRFSVKVAMRGVDLLEIRRTRAGVGHALMLLSQLSIGPKFG